MSLQEKIMRLKMDAVVAARHASFWQKAINEYGEEKATQFYTHLGLNHLTSKTKVHVSFGDPINYPAQEKKSFDFEGLTLFREPKEHEKIAVKGIAQAQESSKEAIGNILLSLRTELILAGLEGIKKLDPATYHELILETPAAFRSSLRDRLTEVHLRGRQLVAVELSHKRVPTPEQASRFLHMFSAELKLAEEDEFDELDTLTDLTDPTALGRRVYVSVTA